MTVRVAAANQALTLAFQAARRSGVSADELRAEQDEWEQVQAAAAGRSRGALLQAYRERIGMLRELAEAALDDAPPARPAYGQPYGYGYGQGYAPAYGRGYGR